MKDQKKKVAKKGKIELSRKKRIEARKIEEQKLDDAIEDSFPASDPISMTPTRGVQPDYSAEADQDIKRQEQGQEPCQQPERLKKSS